MKFRPPRASAVVAVLAASLSFSAGCTSSGDATGPGASDYCSELSNYIKQCNVTDACTVATSQNCTQYAAAYSPAALSAISTCASNIACTDAGSATATACIQAKEAAITPSAAQQKLAQDYCGVCAASLAETTATCSSTFYVTGSSSASTEGGSVQGSPEGFGSLFLEFNDSFSTSVDTACVAQLSADAGELGCIETFELCAETQLEKIAPTPAACESTTGGSSARWHLLPR